MANETRRRSRDTTRVVLETPTFSPPPGMRAEYLEKRRNELGELLFQAGENDWKPVSVAINHVRGSGAMFGFPEIGAAAEAVVHAVQNGDAKAAELLQAYADAVGGASV